MRYYQIIFRVLAGLTGATFLIVGSFLIAAKGFPEGTSQVLLGTMFLVYGAGSNNGYRQFLKALAIPVSIIGSLWFGHGLWVAATKLEVSGMLGEGVIPMSTQPLVFSVVVWGKLVMFAICSISWVLVIRMAIRRARVR